MTVDDCPSALEQFGQPREGFADARHYFGRYRMLWRRGDGYLLALGPQWWIGALGLGGLAAVLCFLLCAFASQLRWLPLQLCCALGAAMLVVYALLLVLDPGVVPVELTLAAALGKGEETVYTCRRCLTVREAEAFHCNECDVCVRGMDHHCLWLGKCVGQRTLPLFYALVAGLPLFFGLAGVLGFLLSTGAVPPL